MGRIRSHSLNFDKIKTNTALDKHTIIKSKKSKKKLKQNKKRNYSKQTKEKLRQKIKKVS